MITPSIQGHPEWVKKDGTDKGIGWFRSDDKVDNAEIEDTRDPQIELDENGNYIQVQYGKLSQTGGTNTKTRRILEMQSDFFQKIRNNFTVKGNNYTKSKDKDNNSTYFLNGKSISKSEHENGWNEYLNTPENSEDAFLKLLLRNDNWITFFIKSIVQDSAKKGYEKVLFPKGETAAKIEGHETIADEIRKIDGRINTFKKQIAKLVFCDLN